jgi:hypothetical protein
MISYDTVLMDATWTQQGDTSDLDKSTDSGHGHPDE